jgi:hypothetical protein
MEMRIRIQKSQINAIPRTKRTLTELALKVPDLYNRYQVPYAKANYRRS